MSSKWSQDEIDRMKASWKLHNGKMAKIQRESFPKRSYDEVRNQCFKLGLKTAGQPASTKKRKSIYQNFNYISFHSHSLSNITYISI